MGYSYTNNSIELLNHCEEHASENIRVGYYYTNNSIELFRRCEDMPQKILGWGTIILLYIELSSPIVRNMPQKIVGWGNITLACVY